MKIGISTEWRERLASALLWHVVGLTAMLLLVVSFAVRLGMDWTATNGHSSDALAGKQIELKALEMQTAPLRGMEERVNDSRKKVQNFYMKRIPASYSLIAGRIGTLQVNSGVRLTRVQYSQGLPGSNLTEITMDAGISGGYPEIMRFVNSLERDQTFFVIRAMALTGQQGGTVTLRLRVSTWLRAADAAASGLPQTSDVSEESAEQHDQTHNSKEPSNREKEGR